MIAIIFRERKENILDMELNSMRERVDCYCFKEECGYGLYIK